MTLGYQGMCSDLVDYGEDEEYIYNLYFIVDSLEEFNISELMFL